MASWLKLLAKIPKEEFKYVFSRSGGPGGQNVNKVNSKATIRLSREKLAAATWLEPDVRAKVAEPSFRYTTKQGDIIISSELTRSQHDNLDDCFRKLATAIDKVAFVPAEASAESKQRWKKLEQRELLKKKETKKRLSLKKQDRKL